MDNVGNRFFGRERIVREIVMGVLAPQPTSFSIVGTKYTGKTLLLQHLTAPDGPLHGEEFDAWRPAGFADGRAVISTIVDCSWSDVRSDLMGYLVTHVRRQLETNEGIDLDWRAVESQPTSARQMLQVTRQLRGLGLRLVVFMDNFDRIFEDQLISHDNADELRPLTLELALVVTTQQPLHDLDRELAASPLFNVMTQLFIGLIEPEAARAWLMEYAVRFPAVTELMDLLLELTGMHPFLLRRVGDIFGEIQQYLAPGEVAGPAHAELIRLRLAEHGRLLFTTQWRKLQEPTRIPAATVQALLTQLVAGPLSPAKVERAQMSTLNWLINQAVVSFGPQGYKLYSPLFAEFIAPRLQPAQEQAPRPVTPGTPLEDLPIYTELTKTEEALLRYFRARANTIISPEQLLADVWNRPDASPRRVQEAIRRLRLQLAEARPPVGNIENERGRGYRFVPSGA